MDASSDSTRRLAQALLALEADGVVGPHPNVHESAKVQEKLRTALTRFAGADGFSALMRRSLALARAEAPSLQAVSLRPDGTVVGLEELSSDAAETLTYHLLTLLVAFIGAQLTLRLIRDVWPELPLETQTT